MAHQVPWNKIILNEFIELAELTQEEEMILRTRVKGHSRVQQSLEFNLSVSTIDRITKRLKHKYDMVQPYSDKLPPRKFTTDQTYKYN